MLVSFAHYGIHFFLPFLVALLWYKPHWKQAFFTMLAGILIDLDHLLANPIFDPNRCSIGFHPLHSSFFILLYLFLLIPKKSRVVALGLVIHIFADLVNCIFM